MCVFVECEVYHLICHLLNFDHIEFGALSRFCFVYSFVFSKEIRNECVCAACGHLKRKTKQKTNETIATCHSERAHPRLWLEKDRRHQFMLAPECTRGECWRWLDGWSWSVRVCVCVCTKNCNRDQLSLAVLIFSLHNDFLTYLFLGVHFNKWANICFSPVTQN